jgi:hypothetical protein
VVLLVDAGSFVGVDVVLSDPEEVDPEPEELDDEPERLSFL